MTWSNKKWPTMDLSCIEAEYSGAAITTCEVDWSHKLLGDFGLQVNRKVFIYCDNLSSIQLAQNTNFHAKNKHIEVHYHYI